MLEMSGLRLLQLLLFKPSSTCYGKAESKANTNINVRCDITWSQRELEGRGDWFQF